MVDNRDRSHAILVAIRTSTSAVAKPEQQLRKRWGIETAVREAESRRRAKCGYSERRIQAYSVTVATVLYNLVQYVDKRLEERLMIGDVAWSGQELLHSVRRVSPDNVPDRGGKFSAIDDNDRIQIWRAGLG